MKPAQAGFVCVAAISHFAGLLALSALWDKAEFVGVGSAYCPQTGSLGLYQRSPPSRTNNLKPAQAGFVLCSRDFQSPGHPSAKLMQGRSRWLTMDAEELLEKYAKGERKFHSVNLSEEDLTGLDLSGIELYNANLSGADLSKANLTGANLNSANLYKASLLGADLSTVQASSVNLSWANLSSADLSWSNLSGANLNYANLENADVTGANLSSAKLVYANLDKTKLSGTNLSSADLSVASLAEADLSRANLNKANLKEAYLIAADLSLANLGEGTLKDAKLQQAKLQKANFYQVDLSGINLADADLKAAQLQNTNLRKSCLRGVNLERANLRSANLIGANLDKANLNRADLTGANIYQASFEDADLTGAIMPDGEVYRSPDSETETRKPKASLEKLIPMTRKVIRTDNAPAPVGPYNQAIVASGQTIFVAGQIAIDPRLGDILYRDDVAKQTEQVMAHLQAILTAAGATFQDVVKTTVFLADMNDFAAVNAVYGKYFDEATAPARACVQVSRLPKDVLVEIDCIAVI